MISPAIAKMIEQVSAEVTRLYSKWVEVEDVAQTMWLWVMDHQLQVEGLPPYTLKRRLKDVGLAYARKEKATRSGYHPEDEYTYSQPVLVKLLPDAFDPEATKPVTGNDGSGAGGKDQTYGEWETMIIDVRVGLSHLGFADWSVLRQVAEGSRAANDLLAQDALRRLQRRCNQR